MDAMASHEELCTERWAQSRKAFDALVESVKNGFADSDKSRSRLHDRVDGINQRILYGVIALLVSGIGTIAGVAWWLTVQIAQMKGLIPS